jgi:hypothetical protein
MHINLILHFLLLGRAASVGALEVQSQTPALANTGEGRSLTAYHIYTKLHDLLPCNRGRVDLKNDEDSNAEP